MSRRLLIINGTILLGCAIFAFESYYFVITALLLFLPFLDRRWEPVFFNSFENDFYVWTLIGFSYFFILYQHNEYIVTAINILVFTALPEEWFFRCYFLRRLELFSKNLLVTNGVCSIYFAIIHLPSQGWPGLLVVVPSFLFGYFYLKSKNLALVILLHGLANLVFLIYIRDWFYRTVLHPHWFF